MQSRTYMENIEFGKNKTEFEKKKFKVPYKSLKMWFLLHFSLIAVKLCKFHDFN